MSRIGRNRSLQVWINRGTANENKKDRGISHLAEHMIFRSRDSRGVAYIEELYRRKLRMNAYTSHNYTVLTISGPNANHPKVVQLIKNMLFYPNFSEADLVREKKVIFNELTESIDPFQTSLLHFFKKIEKVYWGYNLLGDQSIIERTDLKTLLDYFQKTFRKKNTIIVSSTDSLPKFKKPITIIPFQESAQSVSPYFDKELQVGHILFKFHNFIDYAGFLILREVLHRKGYFTTAILNKNVQLGIISKKGESLNIKDLKLISRDLSSEDFKDIKQRLLLNFLRDQETGNDLFHEAEWKLEFGQKVSFRDFTNYFRKIDFNDFLKIISSLMKPTKLNNRFSITLPRVKTTKEHCSLFCFSLIIPFGYMSEKRDQTGMTYAISEILEYRFQQNFPDANAIFLPEFGNNHYGITIWGEELDSEFEKKCYELFINLNITEEEAVLFSAILSMKTNNISQSERFEIISDAKYYKSKKVNCQRYPSSYYRPEILLSFFSHHQKLAAKTFRTMASEAKEKTKKLKHKKTLGPKIFRNLKYNYGEYLAYYPVPFELSNFDDLLSLSSYVNRDDFSLLNELKYERGFIYSFKVKIQKVNDRFYLKMRFKSEGTNEKAIRKVISNYDIFLEILKIRDYKYRGNDIFSRARELLLRKIL